MFEFTVNGKMVKTEKDEKLMTFLREDLNLTSVKNGCAQGVCGTCTVLVDGRAQKSCVLTTAKTAGKRVLTCEGLSHREREVYAHAFAAAGAVQCGFCTPGMVMAAKGLLDVNPEPTRREAALAIRQNLCRCTGYKKVVDAILLAGQIFRENLPVPEAGDAAALGGRGARVDARDKVLGTAEFVDDIRLPGMLHGSAVRSAHPRARVLSIDTEAAKRLPGVSCVLTAADIPGKQKIGHIKKDYDVMIPVGEITHFLGDALALVAAESPEILEQAKSLVRVEYEPLTPVLSLEAAMAGEIIVHGEMGKEDNLLSGEHLVRGDAEAALKGSAHVVSRHFSTPPTEHAFLEPESAVALPDGGGVLIYSADQGAYQTRGECSETLGLPEEKVRVIAKMVGGGFGGKEDMSVQHHAALLAHAAGRPVKVSLTRDESLLIHPKRHGMEMDFTVGCDENGYLTGMRALLLTDSGAYASLGGPVLQRACTHAAGPYNYQNIDITGRAFYSNNPPCGAFRGFGVTQSCFALECCLDLLAEKAGLSPWAFRYRNAIRPGQALPNGQIAGEDTALAECLEALKPYYDANPKAGLACAMKNSGVGVGLPDFGRVRLDVAEGLVHIRSSAACIGQGMGTVLIQIVCETTGLPLNRVVYHPPDTALAPDAGNTTASRQTLFTGEAAHQAALKLKTALEDKTPDELDGERYCGEFGGVTDPMGSKKEHPVSHVAYSYAAHLVELDADGGVRRVVAAHDIGRAINPLSLEGQIEGGAVMSLGYALTERFPLENGRPALKLGSLGLFRADRAPEICPVVVEKRVPGPAYGAKGIGEIAAIPTAPAAALAYYHADGVFRTSLPLEGTPYTPKK